MRAIVLILLCASMVQAQSKPEILPLSDLSANWLWKPQTKSVEKWELIQKESKLSWTGKPIVGGGHEGTIDLVSGFIVLNPAGIPTGGELVADMNTIKNTDMKPDDGGKDLEDHLKSGDFFSVAKYPRATFSIVKVVPDPTYKTSGQVKITGLLTIKGIARPVEFAASTTSSPQNITVKGNLTIDRTKWDVTYQSKSIFKNLKDGIISDDINISVDLKFFIGC